MEKYLKIYNEGFSDGLVDAYKDFIKNKEKKLFVDDKEFISKLYDLSYIYGYNCFCNILKMHLLINEKL